MSTATSRPNIFSGCRACGHRVRGGRYCERCEEEIVALIAHERHQKADAQSAPYILAVVIVALLFLLSLDLY